MVGAAVVVGSSVGCTKTCRAVVDNTVAASVAEGREEVFHHAARLAVDYYRSIYRVAAGMPC